MTDHDDPGAAIGELVGVVAALLADEGGCEWNRRQTHGSLVTYLVEETAELVEAIEEGTAADRREELGDVLYQVVLHAALAAKAGSFDLDDVVRDVTAKTVRRHPHVFAADEARGVDEAESVDDIIRLWSAAKAREKSQRTSAFDGVPRGLPALARAQKIDGRRRAAGLAAVERTEAGDSVGVDGDAASPVDDELLIGRELARLVDAATARGVDAERALRRTRVGSSRGGVAPPRRRWRGARRRSWSRRRTDDGERGASPTRIGEAPLVTAPESTPIARRSQPGRCGHVRATGTPPRDQARRALPRSGNCRAPASKMSRVIRRNTK
jgi:MazG family protein